MIIVSACLAGIECRYDCAHKESNEVVDLVKSGQAIPVCPEQLGGLPTPRIPAEIQNNGRVINKNGVDVTDEYHKGANEALKIAQMIKAKKAILKANSPMCGSGEVYDGSFTGKKTRGDGIFASFLKSKDISIKSI